MPIINQAAITADPTFLSKSDAGQEQGSYVYGAGGFGQHESADLKLRMNEYNINPVMMNTNVSIM